MKPTVGLVIAALVFAPFWARADIGFGPSTVVTSDTQVLDWGLPVMAFDANDSSNLTDTIVDNIDFSGAAFGSDLTLPNFARPEPGSATALAGNLGDILSMALTARGGIGNFAISGLTQNQTYELQIFAGSADGAESETVTDGTSSGDLAFGGDASGVGSIIDTFVAVGSTESFVITFDDGGKGYLDALDLRESSVTDSGPLSDPSPEPPTLAMLLAGSVLALVLAKRCRKQRAISVISAD
jgi:hypothetical protein